MSDAEAKDVSHLLVIVDGTTDSQPRCDEGDIRQPGAVRLPTWHPGHYQRPVGLPSLATSCPGRAAPGAGQELEAGAEGGDDDPAQHPRSRWVEGGGQAIAVDGDQSREHQ